MLFGKPSRSILFKVVSLFMACTFSMYNIGFASVEDTAEVPGDLAKMSEPISVEDIGIAIDCGTVKSRFDSGNNKVIVHIQDAHCNYEAQSNINKMLDQLTHECGIDLISVEGAEGIVDTTWFRAFPDAEIRKEVATYFMKKGEITGAEYFSITSEYNGTIFGAETRDYYVKNLRAFTDVYPYKENIEKYFADTARVANRLKSIIFPPELRKLDSKINAFDNKEIELSEYAEYLFKSASKNRVDINDLENFKKLVKTLEYENKIDFDIVDKERSDYIDALSKKLSKEDMTDLVAESIKFKKGHIKAVNFYTYLRELARENDIPMMREYPNLFYYYIYTKLYDGIDNEGLFKDIDELQRSLKNRLYTNDTQRELDKYAEMVDMFIDLSNIELTNEDYDLFKQYSSEFDMNDVLMFLQKMSGKYNLNFVIGEMPDRIRENIPKMIDFYEIAIRRDNALIDNTLKQMEEEGKDRSVLIAGGFHTRGIKNLLEKKGVSYLVVTPKITKNVETPYIKVLTNQRTSLEDIITESAAVPGVGITASREDIMQPKGDMLCPLYRAGYLVPLSIKDPEELKALSEAIGDITGRDMEEVAVDQRKEMVSALVRGWLIKVRDNAEPGVWADAVENWHLLLGAYLAQYEKNAADLGVEVPEELKVSAVVLTRDMLPSISEEFRGIFQAEVVNVSTPGTEAVRINAVNDLFEPLTPQEAKALDEVIESQMEADEYLMGPVVTAQVPLGDNGDVASEKIQYVPIFNLADAIEEYNATHEVKIPTDVKVHPGTGKGRWSRLYLDAEDYYALQPEQIERLANHEMYHILFPGNTEQQAVADMEDGLADVRIVFEQVSKARAARKEEETRKVQEQLLATSKAMASAVENDMGPDIVIIVSSSDEQEAFWQNRLTGTDDIHGSGQIVKPDAVVLSVSESNWEKGAGNGLGTLNGYIQAARKAWELGLIEMPEDAEEVTPALLARQLMEFCKGKSAFMFHTAGKGTRTAPLPGAEVRSKPNIKLPKMVDVEGIKEPATILESVLMQTSIYAPSRKDRLSVFWGDQVIINENSVDFEGAHHAEIFGKLVPLNPDIESYGVLIPGEEGDCKQREKIPMEEVREILPQGTTDVYQSIGSFNVSNAFLMALVMIPQHQQALAEGKGSLNTDPDWWQPLTSTREEYVAMMAKKNIPAEKSGAQWDTMNSFWSDFRASDEYAEDADKGMTRLLGFNDVGSNSYWWDYGQNVFFLNNMQLLTEDSVEGVAARQFFGVNEEEWVADSEIAEGVQVDSSVIQNSTIKKGSLKNCVVIDSTLEEVNAENAIIIGSTVIKLNAVDALCYNAVERNVSLKPGQILADAFHPETGKISMRTDIYRDGSADWKARDGQGAYIYDNLYTYPELDDLMKGVSMEDVQRVKREEAANLLAGQSDAITALRDRVAAKVATDKRGITEARARQIIVHRALVFGDMTGVTVEGYADVFGIGQETAKKELEELVEQGDVMQARNVEFDTEVYDYVEKGPAVYTAVPAENRQDAVEKFTKLRFGTSGLRDFVTNMTDMEVYINAAGYFLFLHETGNLSRDSVNVFSLVMDRRPSSVRMTKAVAQAIQDMAEQFDYQIDLDFGGKAASPAGAYRGQTQDSFAVVITGSHIPYDMNGIKFYMRDGEEVLKAHEKPILAAVSKTREAEYAKTWVDSRFDAKGIFKQAPDFPVDENEQAVNAQFIQRYLAAFPNDLFVDKDGSSQSVVQWQHSAVGRDTLADTLRGLGADVIVEERTEHFVPVDTELVDPAMDAKLKAMAEKHKARNPLSIDFTDGDSDRPGVADEKGNFLTGDKLGLLVTKELAKGLPEGAKLVVALPVSTNYGVLQALEAMPNVEVVKTKIGSPHVVKAMNDAKALADGEVYALGWEANGGFLLGSEFNIDGGGKLTRIASRDAFLPILAVHKLRKDKGVSMSRLFAEEIPAVYGYSDAYKKMLKPEEEGGMGLAPAVGLQVKAKMVEMISPALQDKLAVQMNFEDMTVERLTKAEINGEEVTLFVTETVDMDANSADFAEWTRVKDMLEATFTPDKGFAPIKSINILDGVQVTFANGEVSHLRPSGNDPAFRNYAASPVSQDRANEIALLGVNEIIPDLAQKALEAVQSTPGTEAVRTRPSDATPAGRIVNSILDGEPIFVTPHQEDKVWGVNGTGEYWYGAESGDKSSTGMVGDDAISMADLMEYVPEEFIGADTMRQFGQLFPLVKILTPAKRLSVQSHDAKNELWIITDIDTELAWETPAVIIGFSQASVNEYGDDVTGKYGEALKTYGDKLDSLINVMGDKGKEALMSEKKDVVTAAEAVLADSADREIADALQELKDARSRLEYFYNYRPVEVGDVVAVPKGTLHAAGPGLEIVEPQIPGPTQSYEDGATYPVRYAFPDHSYESAQKSLDLDRVGEMIPDVAEKADPVPVAVADNLLVERMPGMFEDKGLEVHRVKLFGNDNAPSEYEVDDITGFHNLVVVSGTASVEIEGKTYDIPRASAFNPMMLVPTTAGSFKIKASDYAEVIDTFTPLPSTESVNVNNGPEVAGLEYPSSQENLVYADFGTVTAIFDRLEVIDNIPVPAIIEGRAHDITVTAGSVQLENVSGVPIAELQEGDKYSFPSEYDEYRINCTSDLPAQIKVDYEKTREEQIVYETYRMVKKHIEAIQANQVDLILPSEMFVPGGKTTVGSAEWEEAQLRKYISDKIRISTYAASMGLSEAARKSINPDAVAILVATKENINNADRDDQKVKDFLYGKKGKVRTLAIPDIDKEEDLAEKGWFFNREVEGTALLLAAVTPEQIQAEGEENAADDLQKLMGQLTGKTIPRNYLYYMMARDEMGDALKALPADMRSDPFGWLRFLVQNLLLKMPIKPFDATEQLHQRRKVMWSV